jgi:hypothetical protein
MGLEHFPKQFVEALRAAGLSQASFNLLLRRRRLVLLVLAKGAGTNDGPGDKSNAEKY